MGRAIRQIAVSKDAVYALCADGTLWREYRSYTREGDYYQSWSQLSPIPDEEPRKKELVE